jgi:hypothetical protein
VAGYKAMRKFDSGRSRLRPLYESAAQPGIRTGRRNDLRHPVPGVVTNLRRGLHVNRRARKLQMRRSAAEESFDRDIAKRLVQRGFCALRGRPSTASRTE